ncbi:MAG: hypothetical protein NZ920_03875 [Aigarchaeota archaeon]|nr:hypothetical protein [Aigarchaeota archaeon]MDW8092241.1 hypothetical protein [Nitrososphaerota archaeon]
MRERQLRSWRELRRAIEGLEHDEGIRIEAPLKVLRRRSYVFISRSDGTYIVNRTERVYDRRLRGFVPGGKEEWAFFDDPAQLLLHINQNFRRPLKAWIY